jgi:hypothetical protein
MTHHIYTNDSPAGVAHDQTVRLCGSAEQTDKQLQALEICRAAFGRRGWRKWREALWLIVGLVVVIAVVNGIGGN